MMNKEKISIAVVGESSCGKTQLLNRMLNDEFSKATNETMSVTKLQKEYKNIELHFFELSGKPNCKSDIGEQIEKSSDFVILCIDILDKNILHQYGGWNNLIGKNKIFVETKSDIKTNKKLAENTRILLKQMGFPSLFKTSAKTGEGIIDLKFYLCGFIKSIFDYKYGEKNNLILYKFFTPDEPHEKYLGKKELSFFASTSTKGFLQIKEMAQNKFSGEIHAIPEWPPGVTQHMLSFLGNQDTCKKVVEEFDMQRSLFNIK